MQASLLHLAAAVTLIVVGILLLAETLDVRDGLALISFALAALALAVSSWRPWGP